MINEKDLSFIGESSGIPIGQCRSVIELLDDEMTIPFIARYRKEKTGSLDEVQVQAVRDAYDYLKELNERKETVLKTIAEQNKLTPELQQKIEATYSKTELEDLYLPYKPKRKTKAAVAREKGLEPLALAILDPAVATPLEELATPFVDAEKGVAGLADAVGGAGHIIAESFAEKAEVRQYLRQELAGKGTLCITVTDEFKDKRTKFEQYYDYKEPLKAMPSHRLLAVLRGENEKVLTIHSDIDREAVLVQLAGMLYAAQHPRRDLLEQFLRDAFSRLLFLSIESDVRAELKKNADEEAIKVFATNMENLLLTSPAGAMRTLGVDPGFRTGCKIAALDETGKLLENATIYPTKPQEKTAEAKKVVLDMIARHKLQAVAIGNGTASRETRVFFKQIVPESVIVTVVSEAGASVYSASEVGREEFPDHDLTVRGAVSIGRRFQDPLSELVKIDPKAIGVGQYQHDVNQSLLKKKLDEVVVSVVNRVGVDLNTASYHILKYISGIGETLARNIVQHRNENGAYRCRQQLLDVRLFGKKAFQQSAGFLRIRDGSEPLDSTGIHPESYSLAAQMAEAVGRPVNELIRNKALISKLAPERFVNADFGMPTVQDILKELESPARDPRRDFDPVDFADEVMEIADLQEGMVLNGVITNVTNFGAFVDIGVHQDGLVHISELSHRYIKSPEEVAAVGDRVKVKVLKVDAELKRINLSIKALLPPPEKRPFTPKPRKEMPVKKKFERDLDDLKKAWGSK